MRISFVLIATPSVYRLYRTNWTTIVATVCVDRKFLKNEIRAWAVEGDGWERRLRAECCQSPPERCGPHPFQRRLYRVGSEYPYYTVSTVKVRESVDGKSKPREWPVIKCCAVPLSLKDINVRKVKTSLLLKYSPKSSYVYYNSV